MILLQTQAYQGFERLRFISKSKLSQKSQLFRGKYKKSPCYKKYIVTKYKNFIHYGYEYLHFYFGIYFYYIL